MGSHQRGFFTKMGADIGNFQLRRFPAKPWGLFGPSLICLFRSREGKDEHSWNRFEESITCFSFDYDDPHDTSRRLDYALF
jgi:hypothetical protein